MTDAGYWVVDPRGKIDLNDAHTLCGACLQGDLEHERTGLCGMTHSTWKNCGVECCARQACDCDGRDGLHRVECPHMVADQPNAMLDDSGGFFFPDDAEEAAWFAREHGASPLNPEAFRAMFGDVEGVGIVMGCCGRSRSQPTPKPAGSAG